MEIKRASFHFRRLWVLSAAFLVILLGPPANYYLHIDWIQGWYQSLGVGKFWFVSPLEGLESILVAKQLYLPAIIAMLGPMVLAMLLGSVFCSWLCPISFFSELLDILRRRLSGKKWLQDHILFPRRLLWYVLVGELIITMILGAPVFVFVSPPGLVGRELMTLVFFHTLALEGVILILVLGMNLVTRRLYCRHFCPLGATLNLIGCKRRLVIRKDHDQCTSCGLCDRQCPLGLSPATGMAESIYCWNCGECVDACKTEALSYQWHQSINRTDQGVTLNPMPKQTLPSREQ
ncbi:MAG: 4Fe-4S binding protein [Pseudomonadota bacterium]